MMQKKLCVASLIIALLFSSCSNGLDLTLLADEDLESYTIKKESYNEISKIKNVNVNIIYFDNAKMVYLKDQLSDCSELISSDVILYDFNNQQETTIGTVKDVSYSSGKTALFDNVLYMPTTRNEESVLVKINFMEKN